MPSFRDPCADQAVRGQADTTMAEIVAPADGDRVEFWCHRMALEGAGIEGWYRGGRFWSLDGADHYGRGEVVQWHRKARRLLGDKIPQRRTPAPDGSRGHAATGLDCEAAILGAAADEGKGR